MLEDAARVAALQMKKEAEQVINTIQHYTLNAF